MDKNIVGILRGGEWENYKKSLDDGRKLISHIFENLSNEWKPIDILIDKEGIWHFGGLPIEPAKLINKVKVIWNTSHPSYSKVLQDLSVPDVGINHFSKLLTSNELLKDHMKKIGVNMPRSFILPVYQEDFDGPLEKYITQKAREVFNKFSSPWIVKPLTEDLNVDIHLANTFPELMEAIADCIKYKKSILIEEFIFGRKIFTHLVSGFRKENIYIFPPIEKRDEIIISPGKFSHLEKEKLMRLVKKIFSHINASQYLKLDFILHPSRGFFLTNVEFHPNLNKDSCFNMSCESVGTKTHDVVDHILKEASNKKYN
jgi:hypothetical protein